MEFKFSFRIMLQSVYVSMAWTQRRLGNKCPTNVDISSRFKNYYEQNLFPSLKSSAVDNVMSGYGHVTGGGYTQCA
jgi:hypothetical protein